MIFLGRMFLLHFMCFLLFFFFFSIKQVISFKGETCCKIKQNHINLSTPFHHNSVSRKQLQFKLKSKVLALPLKMAFSEGPPYKWFDFVLFFLLLFIYYFVFISFFVLNQRKHRHKPKTF